MHVDSRGYVFVTLILANGHELLKTECGLSVTFTD